MKSLLGAMAMNRCKSIATLGTKGAGEQSKCVRFD